MSSANESDYDGDANLRNSYIIKGNEDNDLDLCADEEEIEEYENFTTLKLYNPELTFAENFENDYSTRYMLFKITRDGFEGNDGLLLATPGIKVIADIEKLLSEDINFETIVVDYDTMFGLRLLTFQRYSSFFICDERILFEALLIKYRAFNFIPFYWSFAIIFTELGIKKDRAATIIKRFISLGLITSEVKRTIIEGQPRQVTYYSIIAERVIELMPQIYFDYESIKSEIEKDIIKYLEPALKKIHKKEDDKTTPHISQIMQ